MPTDGESSTWLPRSCHKRGCTVRSAFMLKPTLAWTIIIAPRIVVLSLREHIIV